MSTEGHKILHILDHSLPVQSGYSLRSHAIIQSQNQQGWEAFAVTSPKHYESWDGGCVEKEKIHDVCYHHSPAVLNQRLPVIKEFRLMAALTRSLKRIIQLEKPDILHAHSPILNALPALLASRKAGLPFVYEMRALWEDAAVDHGTYGKGSWKYNTIKFLETWVCRQADQVSVLCEGLRHDLEKRGVPGEKLTVVPNGVDPTIFYPRKPLPSLCQQWNLMGKKVIGFLGSFFRYEGLNLLVKALGRLVEKRQDIVLLLVGAGEVEAELKSQVQHLKLENHVIMPGRVRPDQIPDVYALVDILAYPRYSGRLTELVTPLKPLEGMAMEKAVVASDIGGHRELITNGQTGYLFKAGSVSALVEALNFCLEDEVLRQGIAQKGAIWVRQERSWSMITTKYKDIYRACIEKSHTRKSRVPSCR